VFDLRGFQRFLLTRKHRSHSLNYAPGNMKEKKSWLTWDCWEPHHRKAEMWGFRDKTGTEIVMVPLQCSYDLRCAGGHPMPSLLAGAGLYWLYIYMYIIYMYVLNLFLSLNEAVWTNCAHEDQHASEASRISRLGTMVWTGFISLNP
jgi:hypothetical protein